jgi:hypothetical protein
MQKVIIFLMVSIHVTFSSLMSSVYIAEDFTFTESDRFALRKAYRGPGSKMKCNALECLLKIQAQKGVANEKVPSINSMGKNKDSDVKAIGVLINEDCRSA